MSTSRAQNIAHFNRLSEGDGDRYKQTMEDMEQDAEFTFALLSNELIRFKTLGLLWRAASEGVAGAIAILWLCHVVESRLVNSALSV